MTSGTANLIAEAYDILDPEDDWYAAEPQPINHCTCGSAWCHYSCDPIDCMAAAWEAFRDAQAWDDDDYND